MMTYVIHPEQAITDIADAIRSKRNTDRSYSVLEMPAAIRKIGSSEGEGTEQIIVDSELSSTSENPVQNKVINGALETINTALTNAQNRITFTNTDSYSSGSASLTSGNIVIVYEDE